MSSQLADHAGPSGGMNAGPSRPAHPAHLTYKLAQVRRPNDEAEADDVQLEQVSEDSGKKQKLSRPMYSLEFFPPKTVQGLENLYARIARMARPSLSPSFPEALDHAEGSAAAAEEEEDEDPASPSWIHVTWGAGGSTDRWSLEMAGKIQAGDLPFLTDFELKQSRARRRPSRASSHRASGVQTPSSASSGDPTHTPANDLMSMSEIRRANPNAVDALLHLTCTNVTLDSLRATLTAARSAGVRNILALRGDAPRGQEYWVAADSRFQHATDLVRFIREEHGDYFCIGVAGYPEGHPDDAAPARISSEAGDEANEASFDPIERDIQNLLVKQSAGADFVITQLFYDPEAFLSWQARAYSAGVHIPIIPGIMPIVNYQSFRRMTTLCRVKVPAKVLDDLAALKADDAQVRHYGVELCKRMIQTIWEDPRSRVRAFHFCTLNLEKSVTRVIAETEWWTPSRHGLSVEADATALAQARGALGIPTKQGLRNRKIQTDEEERSPTNALSHLSISPEMASKASLSVLASAEKAHSLMRGGAGVLQGREPTAPAPSAPTGPDAGASAGAANAQAFLAPSLLEGGSPNNKRIKSVRVESAATWDEFPNGRFGDIRSPAYGEIDGYGASLKIPVSGLQGRDGVQELVIHATALHHHSQPAEALQTWGAPGSVDDISSIFVRYLTGELEVIPWCDGPLMQETDAIRDSLLRLNASPKGTAVPAGSVAADASQTSITGKGWWTVGSQPAVDGVDSSDPAFGFGPRGGYVYQKAFVEIFLRKEQKDALKAKIDAQAKEDGSGGVMTYFAGNRAGSFETNMEPGQANAVTWAVFPGQEIVQPTIIEEESFRAWCSEAFAIWDEWEMLFAPKTATKELLHSIGEDGWLMTIVHHDFKKPSALWDFLLKA